MVVKTEFTPTQTLQCRARDSISFGFTTRSFTLAGGSAEIATISHNLPVTSSPDNGGPMTGYKVENIWGTPDLKHPRYEGPFAIGNPTTAWTTSSADGPVSDDYLMSKGATAIARAEPTNPTMDLAVTIAELREGPKSIPRPPGLEGIANLRERSKLARSAGSEYLNVEFGWKPLVSDVRSYLYAVNESDKILRSYHKGSAKKTRRGYHFPSESSFEQNSGGFVPIPSAYVPTGTLSGYETVRKTTDMWFSGAFRYYLPTSDEELGRFSQWSSDARKLYGLRIDPEVLWNAAPWSWLSDWFLNTGDLMHNISAFRNDGLVMQYGYLMNQKVWERTRVGRNSYNGSWASHTYRQKRMYRRQADPYGFGATAQALTSRQTAILAALGLSSR